MSGLIALPWCIKPVFGYIFDKISHLLKSQKIIIFICGVLRLATNYFLTYSFPGIHLFYLFLFTLSLAELFENITCEYLLVI